MPLPNSRLSYLDCYAVWDKALEDPKGVRVRMDNMDQAIFFRMRMHNARKINRVDNAQIYDEDHKMYNASEYDKLAITLRQADEGRVWVYIRPFGINVETIEPLSEVDDEETQIAVSVPHQVTVPMVRRRV